MLFFFAGWAEGSRFAIWCEREKVSAATSLHSTKAEKKCYCLVNKTTTFGTFVFVCVLFHADDSAFYFLPGPRSTFWPPSLLVPFLFRTSPALSHFRLPPSSHMQCTHRHTHTHNISVAMVTLSEAPRFPDKASLSRTLFCVSSKSRADRRSADVSVTLEPTLCVSSKAVHESICAVWGFFVCVFVCVSLVGHRNAGQDVGRKFQRESMWKTHPEVLVTVTWRHRGL